MSVQFAHIDARACRKLWQALLLDQLGLVLRGHDPVSGMNGPMEVQKARSWITSRHFRDVCMLAGVDPEWVLIRLSKQLSQPIHQRAIARQARVVKQREGRRKAE
ncbi:hypothetical protein [Roseicyclus marinus]|uniref:hypothetical protein n=1 Tax=Roseicyclus marinus TaxID=2161673 RepID=UPI00240F9624|nr:hypothetical protein [Roseicyclus marinus]MDG3040455.1 hypothetical protein [Roseicyclus marinus]